MFNFLSSFIFPAVFLVFPPCWCFDFHQKCYQTFCVSKMPLSFISKIYVKSGKEHISVSSRFESYEKCLTWRWINCLSNLIFFRLIFGDARNSQPHWNPKHHNLTMRFCNLASGGSAEKASPQSLFCRVGCTKGGGTDSAGLSRPICIDLKLPEAW